MKGSWPVKTLGDLFEISRGGSPRPIQEFLTDEVDGVNWIMISDASASGKYIERTAKRIRTDGVARSRRVSPGDFLLTNSMSFGRPYIMKTEGCIHDGWLHLKKRDKSIDEDYFYHLLGSEATYAKFERLASGATVKNLNIDLVRSVEVPVPPVLEQRRIATILDKADGLCRKRQEAIQLADKFLRAVFYEKFGDPVANSHGLRTSRIDQLCAVATGSTPARDRADYYEGPHPWIKTGEVDASLITAAEEHISDAAIAETNCKLFPVGTLLIAMYGQGKTRGKVGMLGIPAATNQACAAILPSQKINQYFLYTQLSLMYEHLRAMGRGGNQENLNLGMIKSLEVLVPPDHLVDEFLRVRQKVSEMTSKALRAQAEAEAMSRSLAAKFFS